MRFPARPWSDLLLFCLLASSFLVLSLVLIATSYYMDSFPPFGRILAWLVVGGAVMGVLSMGIIVVRLYVQPVLVQGRKRNP